MGFAPVCARGGEERGGVPIWGERRVKSTRRKFEAGARRAERNKGQAEAARGGFACGPLKLSKRSVLDRSIRARCDDRVEEKTRFRLRRCLPAHSNLVRLTRGVHLKLIARVRIFVLEIVSNCQAGRPTGGLYGLFFFILWAVDWNIHFLLLPPLESFFVARCWRNLVFRIVQLIIYGAMHRVEVLEILKA